MRIIKKSNNEEKIEKILLSFQFLSFNLALGIFFSFLLDFLIFSEKNLVSVYVFYLIFFIYSYFVFFNIFYTVSLVGNCISLYKIKNLYDDIELERTTLIELLNDVRIDIYNQMTYKMKDGCVYPKGLSKVLQEYGLCAKYYSGNLKALQNEVCKGTPVIVMIRVRNDKNWLHYVPVVGFDDRYVFVAESLPELVNCNCKYYNRRIEKKFFLQLWNTAMLKQPLFRNTFYVVTKYNIKKGE